MRKHGQRFRGAKWGIALGCPCERVGRTRSVRGVSVKVRVRRYDRRVAKQVPSPDAADA